MTADAAPQTNPTEAFAVLIGGATGIGFEVARRVVGDGGRVLLGGRTLSRLEAAAAALGDGASWRVVDTGDDASVGAFFDGLSCVTSVFTTAATYVTGSFTALSIDDARSPFESKFWGQYRVLRHAVEHCVPNASLVLMSGAASVRPPGPAAPYVAANAAVEGLARGLAVELAPMRVNAVAPGTIDGHLWAQRPEEVRRAAFEGYSRDALLGRPGLEAEVADAVVYLFRNGYTTGSTLYVDGGYALR